MNQKDRLLGIFHAFLAWRRPFLQLQAVQPLFVRGQFQPSGNRVEATLLGTYLGAEWYVMILSPVSWWILHYMVVKYLGYVIANDESDPP